MEENRITNWDLTKISFRETFSKGGVRGILQTSLFMLIALIFFSTLGKKLTNQNIVDVLRIITVSTTALAALLFSLYRTLEADSLKKARLASRTAGRRFLISTLAGILLILNSEAEVVFHLFKINLFDIIFYWIKLYSSGFMLAYAAYGLFKTLTLIVLIPNNDSDEVVTPETKKMMEQIRERRISSQNKTK